MHTGVYERDLFVVAEQTKVLFFLTHKHKQEADVIQVFAGAVAFLFGMLHIWIWAHGC